jgi:small subunit ribosomal protein S4
MEAINNSISNNNNQMEFVFFNPDTKNWKVLSAPERIQIPENINEQLIVELYSK